jgi:hypothetical protein
VPKAVGFIPLLVVASSADIYFAKIDEKRSAAIREWTFAAMGFIGFMAWLNLLYGLS